jgi:transcriptional regulator with XRE-family HTH domain
MRYVTSRKIADDLKRRIKYGVTQTDIAAEMGISKGYLCDFLQGNREAGPAILKALGYETTPFYRAAIEAETKDTPS